MPPATVAILGWASYIGLIARKYALLSMNDGTPESDLLHQGDRFRVWGAVTAVVVIGVMLGAPLDRLALSRSSLGRRGCHG